MTAQRLSNWWFDMSRRDLPIVYSCSGCSNVAQLANEVALRLDHAGTAQMSCIAGVGGKVPSLVKIARSGQPVIAIDGCPLHCAEACLDGVDVHPDEHVRLYDFGLKKRYGERFDEGTIKEVQAAVEKRIASLPGTEA